MNSNRRGFLGTLAAGLSALVFGALPKPVKKSYVTIDEFRSWILSHSDEEFDRMLLEVSPTGPDDRVVVPMDESDCEIMRREGSILVSSKSFTIAPEARFAIKEGGWV